MDAEHDTSHKIGKCNRKLIQMFMTSNSLNGWKPMMFWTME